jgi:hypothetical protein
VSLALTWMPRSADQLGGAAQNLTDPDREQVAFLA